MRQKHLTLLLLATVDVGRHKADPYVGAWKTNYSANGMSVEETVTNAADGSFSTHARASKNGSKNALIVEDKGTWRKISDSSYEVKLTDTNWSPDGGSAQAKAMIASRMAQNKGQILANANKQAVKTIKWQGNDEFTETAGAEAVTFKRVP